MAAKKHLAEQHIVFQPGVNEELGATAVWGSQMLDLYPQSKKYDGVFGIWYGKGPGVDRCSDVFKHANMAGTSQARRRDRHRRRRPRRQEQHRRAPERPHLQGLRAAGVLPVRRAGHPGHGAACLRDEPLLRRVERHEDDPGGGRILGLGQRRPGPGEDHPARGLRHAARRAAHALARCRAGPGGAPLRLQVVCGAGLRARQQAQLQRGRGRERPLRHHRQRQGLQRHAPGAGRPGAGRRHAAATGHPAAQGQRGLAAGGDHHAQLRAGAAGDPGGRGEAPGHRIPAEGRALQLAPRRAPQRAGQVRRARGRCHRRRMEHAQPERELAAARQGRPDAGDHRQGHRQAAEEAGCRRRHRRAHGDAAGHRHRARA